MTPEPSSVFSRPLLPVTLTILLATALVAFDALSVITMLPSIGADLGDVDRLSAVLTSFLVASSIAVLASGPIIDTLGAQKVFRIGVTVLIAASAGAAAAPTMSWLLALRVAQGIGGGMAFTVALATAAIAYPARLRARAYAAGSSVWGVASVIAPALAAALLAFGTWRMVFSATVPLAVAAAAAGWRRIPAEAPPSRTRPRFDVTGLIVVAVFTASTIVALSQFSLLTVALLPVSLACGVVYWWHSGRISAPVLERRFIVQRPLGPLNAAALTTMGATLTVTAYLPLYVEGGLGRATSLGALTLTALSLAWMAGAIISSRVLDRTTPITVMRAGMGLIAIGLMAGFSVFGSAPAVAWLFVLPVIVGMGTGAATNAMVTLVQATVSEPERGRAAASHQYMRSLGNTLGPAVGGALILLEVSRSAASKDQLQAVLAGENLPIGDATRLALTSGFHWAHAAGIVLVVVALVMTALIDRVREVHPRRPTTDRARDQSEVQAPQEDASDVA
jgi:MFS family permease